MRMHPETGCGGRDPGHGETKGLQPRTERLCATLQNHPLFAVPLSHAMAWSAEEQDATGTGMLASARDGADACTCPVNTPPGGSRLKPDQDTQPYRKCVLL